MRISKLVIENYKSLKKICFSPSRFAVIVGANASGKSNLADALEFLSLVYKHGLEHAIAAKGGYENIAFRRQRRSKSAISFSITCRFNEKEVANIFERLDTQGTQYKKIYKSLNIEHNFFFKASSRGVKADYHIHSEAIFIYEGTSQNTKELLHSITRSNSNELTIYSSVTDPISSHIKQIIKYYTKFGNEYTISSQALFIKPSIFPSFLFSRFTEHLSRIVVYRFSPGYCRQAGTPTPNPYLSVYGENLPALINWLKKYYPEKWDIVLNSMRDLAPEIEDITVEILHTKRLGIFFKTDRLQRPWTADEVSDGTIQSLAILSTLADPRNSLVFIEEPENSIHPWILQVICNQLKSTSKSRTVIITTHSHFIIDQFDPKSIWIMHKNDGASAIENLTAIDKKIEKKWENGEFNLSSLLDSGYIPQYVPGGVL